ncbi:hypothetical protein F0562_030141 [Nyssa sinensis]|uniref:Uncharacterized protein n=1 Tax=Nyssa sinensis TaxID=561372 RepID=A0A5J5AXX8_9ASTE|nr:hypothetical protein F0562_030141 [Nyssa sinensis]
MKWERLLTLLPLDAQICLQGKKKSPCKRITSFQFSPSDLTKVIVTAADSQVRILCGVNVICKFKGVRNPGSHGQHIVSASDDSNVYVWNYISEDKSSHRAKNISSCENFLSHNASIALPWCGMKAMSGSPTSPTFLGDDLLGSILKNGKSKCDEDFKGICNLARGETTQSKSSSSFANNVFCNFRR